MFPILESEPLAPRITRLVVGAPYVARKHQAGHFVIVRVAANGERIPLTIVESDARRGTITLVVQAVGRTTEELCALGPGEAIQDVLGPLGEPTSIELYGKVVGVAGGVGAAVLLPIARALTRAGNQVHTVLGARTKELLILEHELAESSRTLLVSTDDGSQGRSGFVTDALQELLGRMPDLTLVFAVGPLPMMRAVAEVTRPLDIFTYVSLNPIMVDGTGMCGGCRVTVDGQTRFACVDGPEFDAHAVDFAELMRRSRSYVPQECESRRRHAVRVAKEGRTA
jgi:ferredoxin--NADP+ reductase